MAQAREAVTRELDLMRLLPRLRRQTLNTLASTDRKQRLRIDQLSALVINAEQEGTGKDFLPFNDPEGLAANLPEAMR